MTGRIGRGASGLTHLVIAGFFLVMLLGSGVLGGSGPPGVGLLGPTHPPARGNSLDLHVALSKPPPPGLTSVIKLGISSAPGSICEAGLGTCPAGTGVATVTMNVRAGIPGHNDWPAVQVLFLLETTPYDGVYDPSAGVPGSDPCGDSQIGTSTLCYESNAVPFFLSQAGTIADQIGAAHPNSSFTFALVDYFATHDAWDDTDGSVYHVDISKFVNSTAFGKAVTRSFQASQLGGGYSLANSDLRDNFLHSSSVSALYAALLGWGGLNWSNSTHHVLVQIGSTAPRDPSYPEDYCVSPAVTPKGLAKCVAPTCEPANLIAGNLTVPCEGWVQSRDANRTHSIAALAHLAPPCNSSLGGNCTIDVVDVNATPTNPNSAAWSAGGGPGGPSNWTTDASNILQAGCDMASATFGSWAGPTWFTCPSTRTKGTLGYVPIGSAAEPNTANPKLLNALTHIGLGLVAAPIVATGADRPMFLFVPWGNFQAAPIPNFNVVCKNATGVNEGCPPVPITIAVQGTSAYGWNWSDDPVRNKMHLGDTWQAGFDVVSFGPPFNLLPVDACVTRPCLDAGSNTLGNLYTSTTFREYGSQYEVTLGFPLTEVVVEPLNLALTPVAPPPPPSFGSPPGTTPPTSLPVLPPTPASAIPAALIPIEAAASGFIAAGFISIAVKKPPLTVQQASKSGALEKTKKKRQRRRGGGPGIAGVRWA